MTMRLLRQANHAVRSVVAGQLSAQGGKLLIARKLDTALRTYNWAITLTPSAAELHARRGVVRFKMGDLGGAMADFNEAIRLNPRQAEAYNNRGLALHRQGNTHDALADFNMAIFLAPQ